MPLPRRWLTIVQTAELLQLNKKTIYALIMRGEIPSSKIGGSRRIDGKRLEEQMEWQSGRGPVSGPVPNRGDSARPSRIRDLDEGQT